MSTMRVAIVGALLSVLLSSCATIFCGPAVTGGFWGRGNILGPAVANQEAAIIIARAVWLARHPESENESEGAWLRDYKAELWGGAWHVSRSDGRHTGLQLEIARRDGRVLNIASLPKRTGS